jgi:hypothetical protein
MSHGLRLLLTITFAVFWWREIQFECPLTEPCPRVEQQTMVPDADVFTDQEACDAAATAREAAMRTQGWNYVRSPTPQQTEHVRYRYLCKTLLKRPVLPPEGR